MGYKELGQESEKGHQACQLGSKQEDTGLKRWAGGQIDPHHVGQGRVRPDLKCPLYTGEVPPSIPVPWRPRTMASLGLGPQTGHRLLH